MRSWTAFRPFAFAASLAVLLVLMPSCGDDVRSGAVYIEDVPPNGLDDGRTHAVRVTVFEFGTRIGGFVEYFEIDGSVNTAAAPWFRPTACAWFGDGPIREGAFVIDADGLDAATRLLIRATWDGRRRTAFEADWVGSGGVTQDETAFDPPRTFVRDDAVLPSRTCGAPLVRHDSEGDDGA